METKINVISNVVVMTGLCFIMNFFMEKHDNLIYGIVIHFCFNFLYCFLQVVRWILWLPVVHPGRV